MKRVVIPALIVAMGALVLIFFVKTKPEVKKSDRQAIGVLVETLEVVAGTQQVGVEAQGTVVAAQQIELIPEVAGRVVWVSSEAIAGGRFRKGEAILRIDTRDYQLAVEQQRAVVHKAQLELELEVSRGVIARREWQLLNKGGDAGALKKGSLALRGPQLRTAEVGLAAAKSGLERAALNLARTTVRAPFNALVQAETVDVGQQVSPQSRVARLVGTDAFHVQVSVPLDALSWITLPGAQGAAGAQNMPVAVISQRVGSAHTTRSGHVIRLLGDVDPVGRMARLLIELPNPMAPVSVVKVAGKKASEEIPTPRRPQPPLLLGSYVDVAIEGHTIENVITIPRVALRDGDNVYVFTAAQTLEIRPVDVVWRRRDTVLVQSGLIAGERIVISRLGTPMPGMLLRVVGPTGKAPSAPVDAGSPAMAAGAESGDGTETSAQ